MIIISLLRSYKLASFQELIAQVPDWHFVEIERFDISGVPISRIALKCDEMPPPECELVIEGILDNKQYCQECIKENKFTPLQKHNKTGYCSKHYEVYRAMKRK